MEPHPLRDSFISHSQPFNIFSRICKQIFSTESKDYEDIDARIFSSHVLQEIKFNEVLDVWPIVVTPTIEEQKKIEDMAKLWLPGGLNDWLDLCNNSESEISAFYINVLDRIKSTTFDFDVIVSWGQNSAIKRFAEHNKVQTVYMELASMRPPFPKAFLMDPIGVNGAASSAFLNIKNIAPYLEAIPSDLVLSLLNDEFAKDRQNSNLYLSLFNPIIELDGSLANKERCVALVPLQLADDANLLLYSDYKSIEDFVDYSVSTLIDYGWDVIIKPHPHAVLRGGYVEREQIKCIRKYEDFPSVTVFNGGSESDYLSLLNNVDLVVTNNSSLGFEALMVGTQCVTLGRACYSIIDGLPNLEQFLKSDPNERISYKKKAELIVAFMLSFMFPLDRNLGEELINRVRLWKELGSPCDGNMNKWIKANIESLGWNTWFKKEVLKNYFEKDSSHKDQENKWVNP